MKRQTNLSGRPKTKADARIFKLRKDLDKFLVSESRKRNVPMVRIVEDGLDILSRYKPEVKL